MARVACSVTAGWREEAARIGDPLVRERLAACATVVGPVASTYWWKGKVERDRGVLLILRTRKDRVKRLASRVRELHSYEVPEVIAIPIVGGNPAYSNGPIVPCAAAGGKGFTSRRGCAGGWFDDALGKDRAAARR